MSYNYSNKKPVVEMKNIVRSFFGVKALDGISFNLYPGEIHCIVGENGAGKSTLMKVLSGALTPDSGEILIEGSSHRTLNPKLSRAAGINIIYQENLLIPAMNVVENVFSGIEITNRFGIVKYKEMLEITKNVMTDLEMDLDVTRTVETLSVAKQQYVKILRALVKEPKVLIMDEPTSMFNVEDADGVLRLVKKIAEKGLSIIYISHFLKEVTQIADRVTVIRDGKEVSTYINPERDIDIGKLANDMVGRPVDLFYKKEKHPIGDVAFEVSNLKLNKNSPSVSFQLKKGEILGFAGMVGSGRTEIMRAITGVDRKSSGVIRKFGKEIQIHNPRESIDAGIAFITEDRQKQGLVLNGSVLENLTIVGLGLKIKGFFINIKAYIPLLKGIVSEINLKAASPFQEVRFLSGGNQQKVVLGKWLFTDADLFILDEPTRGVDVNSKAEFYNIMSKMTKSGKSVIMISSDMVELVSMCDRIAVVKDGKIVGTIEKEEISEQAIISYALETNNYGVR
jgi:ABC-type sugar transport system ATPase subunit